MSVIAQGCYGLAMPDWPGTAEFLFPAEPTWPGLAVDRVPLADVLEHPTGVGRERADIELIGGRLQMRRNPLEATFLLDRPIDANALVHPYLALPAGIAGHWLGRQAFHGGAFVLDGGAWGVLADKEGGKSSTMAWFDQNGIDVLADDLLVVEDGLALAGPRCIDLRTDTATTLGIGTRIDGADGRDRWRLLTKATTTVAPLVGWIFLSWAAEPSFLSVPPSARIARVLAHRSVITVDADPTAFLDLAARPCIEFARPRGLEHMGVAIEALLTQLTQHT